MKKYTLKDFLKNNKTFVIDTRKALRINLTNSFKNQLVLLGYNEILIIDSKTGVNISKESLTIN